MESVRIKTGFARHPKTQALLSRLGYTGGFSFVCLLAWAAAHKPTGDLEGMDDRAIENVAEWPGGDGVLVRELMAAGFLTGGPRKRRIHDFQVHNPISVMSQEVKKPERAVVPFAQIVDLYHTMLCPPCARVMKVTEARKQKMRARWNDSLTDLSQWEEYFQAVKQSDFLMGRCAPRDGRPPFVASLDFLIRNEDQPVKVAEGRYATNYITPAITTNTAPARVVHQSGQRFTSKTASAIADLQAMKERARNGGQ